MYNNLSNWAFELITKNVLTIMYNSCTTTTTGYVNNFYY